MLNVKDNIESISTTSNKQLNNCSFNKSDEQLLKNNLIEKIKEDFIEKTKKSLRDKMEDSSINIKLNYKIPGFFNIYRGIKKYIYDEKISFYYRQDEGELRKCEIEKVSQKMGKLNNDIKDFTENLYVYLASNPLFDRVMKTKIEDENYTEIIELFLNDYITFYLVKLYKDTNNDFVINDIQHKLILLLLDLKFKELIKKEEKKIFKKYCF